MAIPTPVKDNIRSNQVEELITDAVYSAGLLLIQKITAEDLRTMASEADYWNSIPPKHRAMLKRFIDGEDISKPKEETNG
jgi:hypothetical protein